MIKTGGCYLVMLLLLFAAQGRAQSYHAFGGSSYAGVTAIYTNPASAVNQAYKWDVTLFGLQTTISNTAFVVNNNSLLQTNGSTAAVVSGLRPRWVHANVDVNLLNLRYSINPKNAVSFGFRARTYNHFKATAFNYNDTITTMDGFLHDNTMVNFLNGYVVHAGWAELNFSYAHTILQSSSSSLSGGITVSYIKSLSGAFGMVSHANYTEEKRESGNAYIFNQAAASMAYSANYLVTRASNNSSQNFHNFLAQAPSGVGLDIGAEYLFKAGDELDDISVDATHYDWKIGVSIMDIGRNKFKPIDGSFTISGPRSIADSIIQQKLQGVQNARDVRDSLSGLFSQFAALTGNYYISLPTRLIINIDHALGNHFYVNGELSLNFYGTQPAAQLHTRELNLLTITPRWETQALGLYLPVQYNSHGQFWVGAAAKLGPLLVGVHSLDFIKWFKTGQQTYNGGAYMLLSIHPFKKAERKINELDCPR